MGRTSLVSVTVNGLITERVELLLCLTHKRVKPRFHIRQLVAYVVQKHLKTKHKYIFVTTRSLSSKGETQNEDREPG